MLTPRIFRLPREQTASGSPTDSERTPSRPVRYAGAKTERTLPRLPLSPTTRSTSLYLASAAKPQHARLTSDTALSFASRSVGSWYLGSDNSSSDSHSPTAMSLFSPRTAQQNPKKHTTTASSGNQESNESTNAPVYLREGKALPKTPPKSLQNHKSTNSSKLGSLFGWRGNASPVSSSSTNFSDKAYSPLPSPIDEPSAGTQLHNRPLPKSIDIPKANEYFSDASLSIPPVAPATSIQVEEMEEELKEISAELASSIRREMDLEDLVERLQADAASSLSSPQRTSDYYSDSGYSSSYRGDTDPKQEQLERLRRKAEQEKAQVTLELTAKVQDERERRKVLEKQIRALEEKASQVSLRGDYQRFPLTRHRSI